MPKIFAPEDFGWVSLEFSLLWKWIADPRDIVIDEDNTRHNQAIHPFPLRIAIATWNDDPLALGRDGERDEAVAALRARNNISPEAPSKIILVTGANQGLGLGVIEVAGRQGPQDVFILCSRDVEKGTLAVKQLREAGVKANIDVVQLEVTVNEHIAAAVKHVQKQYAFRPLLYKSTAPKVINVTSGIASIQRALAPGQRMGRAPHYGAAKIGMNGTKVHMQLADNDHVAEGDGKSLGPRIRFFIVAPGVLKTAFSNFISFGKSPTQGAEAIVRLLEDEEGKYDGAVQWEFEGGDMREIPW
ncbi:Carbonyl reductase [NADPH] 1 [Cytospora mali]|uniref:Carbonyl reductase [NADPH] 1 n=1 Tax=Cytospora mali TaxID=578113 RepID=A0A194VU74_CYTMA|nr:Carbonyl reductase [NADPH] 1 [Valsa mali]